MRLVCFNTDSQEKRVSREIEKKLAEWYKDDKKAIKLLLLGTGESGKTTIIKQMKILHISGFSESERMEKASEIRENAHEAIYDLVTHLPLLDPPIRLHNSEVQQCARFIQELGPNAPDTFSQMYLDVVARLWTDPSIQECYLRSNEFQLIDSTKYFLNQIHTVGDPKYIPSDEDILHCRRKTTAIQKVEFSVKVPGKYGGGSKLFLMYDVGGQRGYRRKWIQVFEGIHAILFLVAASDFDQTLREDEDVNRLEEALNVFDDVWNSRFLQDSGLIIFLNKQDVLKAKIESGKCIGNYFPGYYNYELSPKDGNQKENDEYLKTRCFIRDMFISKTKVQRKRYSGIPNMPERTSTRELYHHFTIATDTSNIRTVFDDVHSSIIMQNLEIVGIQ